MKEIIERTRIKGYPSQAPRMAVQNLRSVVGVFKYMQEPEVAQIFKDEKIRIGTVIDGIDRDLPQLPTLGLGARWDTYMDEVFATARDKGISFMDDIQRLKDEYTSQAAKDKAKDNPQKTPAERDEIAKWAKLRKETDAYTMALEAEWNNVRNWARPW
ncbi:hypothetical protein BU25DRAFT_458205 [Macroventuria anomochaeta]|uniref:Uncharacterized protein n=1 Tax=Macroventuria anomochaeta TaxID=301207 RepID=A0ACB6S193_9PLEO|nr:uncharacterized protein BU25DRAFT_458205 [Macroventuria anomochaeta]KAF2627798.1 hypothetical protein BU25DRAFT_458205 [Macroventuria anomochaeta]